MKKYNLSKIMKRAWEIKKENEKNVFSLCLKMAWEEAKNGNGEMEAEKIEKYLASKGLRIWEKGGHRRMYFNAFDEFDLKRFTPNVTMFRKVKMYYDSKENTFCFSCSSSRENSVRELISAIRKEAAAA